MIFGRLSRLSAMIACASLVLAGCGDGGTVIHDDFGPPAGYAVLAGTLARESGDPVPGVEITFTRCSSPVGGLLASTTSDAAGAFRVSAHLSPIVPDKAVDTLHVRCYVFLDRAPTIQDSVTVRFATTEQRAPVTTITLQVP